MNCDDVMSAELFLLSRSALKTKPHETDPAALILFSGCFKPIKDGQVNDVIVGSMTAGLEHQVSTQRKQVCPLKS